VALHGGGGDAQVIRDLGVREAAGDEHEHVELSVGEAYESRMLPCGADVRLGPAGRQVRGKPLQQAPGDPGRDDGVAGRHGRTAETMAAGSTSLSRDPVQVPWFGCPSC
jgi:hypothetical protein